MPVVVQDWGRIAAHEDDFLYFVKQVVIQQVSTVEVRHRTDGNQGDLTGILVYLVCNKPGRFTSGVLTGFRTPQKGQILPADLLQEGLCGGIDLRRGAVGKGAGNAQHLTALGISQQVKKRQHIIHRLAGKAHGAVAVKNNTLHRLLLL